MKAFLQADYVRLITTWIKTRYDKLPELWEVGYKYIKLVYMYMSQL